MSSARDLLEATRTGDTGRVRQLLAEDAALARTTDDKGVPAVLVALYHGQAECARVLADAIGDDDVGLSVAAALGDERLVRTRLDADGASGNVDARTPDGFTALHLAAFFGHAGVARLLLQSGADPDAVADNGSRVRPIHSAAAAASAPTIRLLLEHGAEADAAQHGGWTALQAVAKRDARDCIDALLAAGADPDKPADDGTTARDLGNL